MKRQHLLAVLALVAVTGCREGNGSSIEITGNALQGGFDPCAFTSGGALLLGNGFYDPAPVAGGAPVDGGAYILALYIQNNLADPNSIAPGSTTDSKGWRPENVRVRVNPKEYTDLYKPSPALAAISVADLTLPVAPSSTVKPGGGNGVFVMNIFGDGLTAALQGIGVPGTLVLGITLQGRTNDGARLDSVEWPLAIDVLAPSSLSLTPTCPTGTTAKDRCVGQTLIPVCR
jgi:hypothetical protein